MSKLIFCLMGPTASGKTALACELVRHFPFEIISVDSAMIYRGMDIGTAKPDVQTLKKAPHYLIDILNPSESYSVAKFCDDAHSLCHEIVKKGKYPLLVGGTMMYFNALQQGLSALPEANEQIREDLLRQAQTYGWGLMHQLLTNVDPSSASRIHVHDTQRIQRALEVYNITGKPLSAFLNEETLNCEWNYINLRLMPKERQWLHQRIALRFEQMLKEGFVAEVETLVAQWGLEMSYPSMRSVGYRQVLAYLQNEYDFSTMSSKSIVATRQLAKRQLTWLRNWPEGYIVQADGNALGELMVIVSKILDNCNL